MPRHAQRAVSLFELEAAEFFKLDLDQINLGREGSKLRGARWQVSAGSTSSSSRGDKRNSSQKPIKMQTRRDQATHERSRENIEHCRRARSSSQSKRSAQQDASTARIRPTNHSGMSRSTHALSELESARARRGQSTKQGRPSRHSPNCRLYEADQTPCSSISSTNSLPSISSSPSVSPSLVCPHLSLDDILAFRRAPSGSPHTIGLCQRCRLDPPPNVHSPLSPRFKPHNVQASSPPGHNRQSTSPFVAQQARHECKLHGQAAAVRRGYSDHQAGSQELAKRRRAGAVMPPSRHKSDVTSRLRDDSLDYCLAPAELKRMQLSPSLRNSVEFIRKNSIESGRVVRIYKNCEPFEKPLRVCILRDEFRSLNHLLDHINSRLLVPNGARFLFHLDGQPVYSVHELKHASAYVVSGTRHYDYRTGEVLKASQQHEQRGRANRLAGQARQMELVSTRVAHESSGGGAKQTGRVSAARKGSEYETRVRPESGQQRNAPEMSQQRLADDRTDQLGASTMRRDAGVKGRRAPVDRLGGVSPADGLRADKFSRYDSSTALSSSDLNASSQLDPTRGVASPAMLTRAKSELSALPTRRAKKNVTFLDTGRGSSPAISELSSAHQKTPSQILPVGERPQPEVTPRRAGDMSTSEIGIQVSDSLDGFLIDLPVALPAKNGDANVGGTRAESRVSQANRRAQGRAAATGKRAPKQIVTISERQLSLEEMNELRDLSAGDHHHEVAIKRDPGPEGAPGAPGDQGTQAPEPEVVPDFTDTIAIGTDPGPQQVTKSERLITGASIMEAKARGLDPVEGDVAPTSSWQYPGGRASTATPTERPVSQSGPSETVRARVTTPTPSLSTCGDNNSLTMSYETILQGGTSDKQTGPLTPSKQPVRVERLRTTPSELPAKRRVEVEGALFSGADEPKRNFRLAWVNGFAINDLYPENTYSATPAGAEGEWDAGAEGRASGASSPNARLTPSRKQAASQMVGAKQRQQAATFKPSERYHNWICHSRKHDELIYPAGTLIVLWCRWTNEQRYYARHTSNVTAVSLATLDLDLAASAQVCDLNERPQIASSIHLWSLTSLSTLLIVQDEQFRAKLIFSLRLRSTRTSGCELSIAARDEKQLLLFEFNRKLAGSNQSSGSGETAGGGGGDERRTTTLMMKATKPLQSNQLPLYLLRVPNTSENQQAGKQQQQKGLLASEPIISFGRRHFNIWAGDPKLARLRPMQCAPKNVEFTELISRANCLCRLSPGEFLVGDSDGRVALLLIECRASQGRESAAPKQAKTTGATRTPAGEQTSNYSLELINLLGTGKADAPTTRSPAAITCLARVTGSLFMSADSTRTISFWKIKRARRDKPRKSSVPTVRLAGGSSLVVAAQQEIECEQLSSISLPPDLGFICTLIMAQYDLRESLVEFYVVSTSNTILFGSVKLPSQYARPGRASEPNGGSRQQVDLLANSSLSVVYEGHETAASSLVADVQLERGAGQELAADDLLSECQYFTCSLDCRICKWQGRRLVWKSLLPSSCASLAVHPTGFVLAVGSLDGTVYILDRVSGLLVSYFPLTPVRINCLAYSSDGSLLAAACANGSIFMLPVYERGLKYKKVSIFQSPHPVVSLQFSLDNRYMLTSITHGAYQELILWDLPNFRYMRDNVKLAVDKIRWFDSICSGSEDVRAIWENANLANKSAAGDREPQGPRAKRAAPARGAQTTLAAGAPLRRDLFVVNLSCHRLIKAPNDDNAEQNFVVASDTRGYLRLFRYPCYDIQQGFLAVRISSSAVNCCRFLQSSPGSPSDYFVSTSLDGSICLWAIQ